jgi:hypothetical protein
VIRQVFVYPLLRDWRRALVAPISPPAQEQKRAPDKDRTQKRENADRPQELAPQGGSVEMSTAEQALNEIDRGPYPAAICGFGTVSGRKAAPITGRG